MSVITAQLRRLAERRPLDEKLIVTSSGGTPQEAVTLRDRLAAEGTPWIGFREATVADLAERVAAPRLVEEGLRSVPSTVQLFLVQELVEDHLAGEVDGYFGKLDSTASVLRTARGVLKDLRGAGLAPDDLDPDAFVSREKGAALRRLLAGYGDRLTADGWTDDAGVVMRALDALEDGDGHPVPVLCVLGDMRLTAVEARLLEQWPADERFLLGWPGDVGVEPGSDRARVRLTNFTVAEADGDGVHPAGRLLRRDGTEGGPEEEISLAVAVGGENEVREALREAAARDLRLDQVELVYTDPDRYRDLVRSEAEALEANCTFAEGLPVKLTRPGQALRLFYDWILEDFDDRILRRLLRAGLLDFRQAGITAGELLPTQGAALLREARIGSGRERYGTALDRLRRRLELRRQERAEDGRAMESLDRRLELLDPFERLFHPDGGLLWTLVPGAGEVPVPEVASLSVAFLERLAARHGGLEPPAHESLARRLREVADEVTTTLPRRRVVRLLRDEIELHPISRSGPKPGCLHVAPFSSGGLAGRELTVVVGLDEGSFPGTAIEDPFLLDRERRQLSPDLPVHGRGPSDRVYELSRALGEVSGDVHLTASVLEVADDRELFPSSAFLRAYRIAAGDPRAGVETCLEAVGPPVSYVPGTGKELDEMESWLQQRNRAGYAAAVRSTRPSLARGHEAELARASEDFTVWDGRVPAAAEQEQEDPRATGTVVSASRLETLLESPYRYFLRYVLDIEPVEELAYEKGEWLDPLERGSLLHELFRRFMDELRCRGERPDADRHGDLLEKMLGGLLEEWREQVPPPSEGAFRRQVREIRRTARIFLRGESARADEATGIDFEVGFGFGRSGDGLGSAEPVPVEIGPAGTLHLRGSIDRVDRLPDGAHRLWDYKTGSPRSYSRADPFTGGRLQWLLYALALEWLLDRQGADSRVATSGYLFPGSRGHGQRFAYRVHPERVQKAGESLSRHLDLVKAGLFPHAPDSGACTWCDYRRVCGDPDTRARQTKAVLASLDEETGGPSRWLARWRDG